MKNDKIIEELEGIRQALGSLISIIYMKEAADADLMSTTDYQSGLLEFMEKSQEEAANKEGLERVEGEEVNEHSEER